VIHHSSNKLCRFLVFHLYLYSFYIKKIVLVGRVFLRFRFGDRKEILRDSLEEFERPFSIDVISGHYILKDRWRNLRDRFGPSKHLKKNTACRYYFLSHRQSNNRQLTQIDN